MSRNTRFNGTKRPDLTGIVGRNPAISPAHAVSQPLTRKESTAARNLLSMSVSNSRVNRRNALSKKAVNRKNNTRTNSRNRPPNAQKQPLPEEISIFSDIGLDDNVLPDEILNKEESVAVKMEYINTSRLISPLSSLPPSETEEVGPDYNVPEGGFGQT